MFDFNFFRFVRTIGIEHVKVYFLFGFIRTRTPLRLSDEVKLNQEKPPRRSVLNEHKILVDN